MSDDKRYQDGMKVRRRILGDEHVDRANARITKHNREFQDLITRYAWGEIWTRPGLSYRERRILVLGTMMTLGRWEEFRLHLRAALKDELSLADIKEIFLQQAIYCGVPVANTAFHHLEEILNELRAAGLKIAGDE